MKTIHAVAIALIFLIIVGFVIAIVTTQVIFDATVQNQGTKTAYVGEGITAAPMSLDWGNLQEGEVATKTLTIENLSPYPVTLSMSTQNLAPTGVIDSITWNITNYVLPSSASVVAEVTLTVSPDPAETATPFTFDLIVNGQV